MRERDSNSKRGLPKGGLRATLSPSGLIVGAVALMLGACTTVPVEPYPQQRPGPAQPVPVSRHR